MYKGRLCVDHYEILKKRAIASYAKNPEPVKERSRKWLQENKETAKITSAAYYEKNSERLKEKQRTWYAANKERKLQSDHAYYEKNKEIIYAKTKEYNKRRPEVKVACSTAHRARKKNAPGKLRPKDWRAICEMQRGLCFDCGEKKKLTVGHLIPLSLGGSNDPSNIRGQCQSCNSKQWAKIHPSVSV